ncbi:uncharacterized protein LOC120440288 isoform X3 [Oreochromis aureus]|uniref:uncharacterized protein LOC120440288 isoform X3 n=1 Tax=Oreochromis aureus TaxID=47969 RepID=UPI00195319B6|nr:uncharacterized protein LOC120440288 isoform X3 [Oreochromis aureus]
MAASVDFPAGVWERESSEHKFHGSGDTGTEKETWYGSWRRTGNLLCTIYFNVNKRTVCIAESCILGPPSPHTERSSHNGPSGLKCYLRRGDARTALGLLPEHNLDGRSSQETHTEALAAWFFTHRRPTFPSMLAAQLFDPPLRKRCRPHHHHPITPQPTPAASAGPAGDGPTVFITALRLHGRDSACTVVIPPFHLLHWLLKN